MCSVEVRKDGLSPELRLTAEGALADSKVPVTRSGAGVTRRAGDQAAACGVVSDCAAMAGTT